eukprot:UN10215
MVPVENDNQYNNNNNNNNNTNTNIIEYDAPYILLNNPNSLYYSMIKSYTTGPSHFNLLYEKAKNCYYQRIRYKEQIWANAPRFIITTNIYTNKNITFAVSDRPHHHQRQ